MPIGRWILDCFFPRSCFYCQQPLATRQPGFICHACFQKIVFNHHACCTCCGRALQTQTETITDKRIIDEADTADICPPTNHGAPVQYDTPHPNGESTQRRCADCIDLQPFFDHGISLFAFTSVGRAFIHTLKYHNGVYLKNDLQRLLMHERSRLLSFSGSVFVPVPLHFMRQWKRGYNQSEWIANALVRCINGTVEPLLRRTINTIPQTHLTRNERKQNMKHAFALRARTLDVRKSYVLVDDVFTTGSTLNECARALQRHGARNIRVFTLAHG